MKLRFSLLVKSAAILVLLSVELLAASAERGTAHVRVGIAEGDLRGADNRALQAAIEYAASLGGGTVEIGPGRYQMRNALMLRDRVDIVGVPGQTVLVACDGQETELAADGDCNERQITLQNPAGFQVGDGVSVQDKKKGGFEVTTATLTERISSNSFRISAPLYLDYTLPDRATARLVFPVVGGWNITNVTISGLTVDGNRQHAQSLNGCRGGGIYLFECADVTIRNCTVREYAGDGISFQVSQRVVVEDCLAENNTGLGLHPGSGSQHPIVRRNRSIGNGSDGLFVCWRVKFGLFENNEMRDNKGAGISIGHKDSDNLFRKNTISRNAGAGVLFREELEAMGAHRNIFEENVVLDNGCSADGKFSGTPIQMRGVHQDVQFRRNTIGYSKPIDHQTAAISAGSGVRGLRMEQNDFKNVDEPESVARQN